MEPLADVVLFEDLADADLVVNRLYDGGTKGTIADDPLAKLLPVGNQGGFRYFGSPTRRTVRLVVLYTTAAEPDWPDALDTATGVLTYYGDNRRPQSNVHSTPRNGNRILHDTFEEIDRGSDSRRNVPPFLLFEKAGPGRRVRFRGLLAPGTREGPTGDLVTVEGHAEGETLANYQARFTVLDAPTVSRAWLSDVIAGHATTSPHCPPSWSRWVDSRAYLTPRGSGWDMPVGAIDSRTRIQQRHGGSHSRGISAPRSGSGSTNIMLWWRPERGRAFGYRDGWAPDGSAFFFSGMGQVGDQQFTGVGENRRVLKHAAQGESIRLLKYTGKNTVQYVGEFRLDPAEPYRWRDGPDALGLTRRIIQFRLLPVGDVVREPDDPVHDLPDTVSRPARLDLVTVPPIVVTGLEAPRRETVRQIVLAQAARVSQVESALVHDFARWLYEHHSIEVTGRSIPYSPEAGNLRVDAFIERSHTLIEAKASAAREHVRMAIGQLLDYRRYLAP